MANEALRYVVLRGPQWSDGQPLWEIKVSAPKLKQLQGEDRTRIVNQLEDRIFPLRVLQTDPLLGPGAPDELFRRPHVVAMHVIAGHSKEPYASEFLEAHSGVDQRYLDRGYPDGFEEYRTASSSGSEDYMRLYRTPEALSLVAPKAGGTLAGSKRTVFAELRWKRSFPNGRRDMPPYWYTMGAEANADLPSQGAGKRVDAQFQHIIAEPLLAPGEDWPGKDTDIRLPAFGLLAGSVSLAVAHGGLPWLGTLQPTAPPRRGPLKISRYPVRLVPDGIELRTSVDFLGKGALEGWFHLGIGREAREEYLVLTLLPERTRESDPKLLDAWQAAWEAAMPTPGTEEVLQGFRVAADLSTVPKFRWRIPALKGNPPQSDDRAPGNSTRSGPRIDVQLGSEPVEFPASAVRVELLSPSGPAGVDGVVNIGGGFYRLGTKAAMKMRLPSSGDTDHTFKRWCEEAADDSLILAWASPAQDQAPRSFWTINSRADKSDVSLDGVGTEAYPCAHNPTLLAERLRQTYGMSVPGTDGDDRELLPAFVPLRDGWLQVQVPNVPPDDRAKDGLDATALARTRQNVLSGFLRFGNASQLPSLYSAFEDLPPRMVEEAPWLVTLEAAERLRIAIELGKAPLSGLAVTDNPELSMRGLLWLSSDRPDALEAIPRMGAGPGAFIDVPLDRLDKETIQDSRRNLQIGLNKLSLRIDRQAVSRTGLDMSLALSKTSGERVVRWQRHPLMPLAAIMPLTRSARSAVRPLESRDLVPFIASKKGVGPLQPLADLTWQAGESLPRMQPGPGWSYELATELAVKGDLQQPDESTRCRLSWAAFGVPGCELVPRKGGDGPWDFVAASRFDLPVNDEAFATATLPPSMLSAEEQARLLAPPSVTALDWGALAAFWGEQQRLLQLSRVAHSYLAGFRSLGQTQPVDVDDLVGGRKWKLALLDFSVPDAGSALPYGAMLVGAEAWSGNRALLGFSGRLGMAADGSLEPVSVATPNTIDVIGYSPGSFQDGEFLRDARGVGTAPLQVLHGGMVRWRAINSRAAKLVGHMSLARPIAIASGAANLKLWFKDLPIDAQGNYLADAGRLSPAAWQDGELERRGVEWRLLAQGRTEGFELGDDTVPFFGLRLRPLRLESMQIEMDGEQPATGFPLRVSLLAELILGPRKEDVGDGGNIVRVDMKRSDLGLGIESIQLFGQRVLNLPVSLPGDEEDAAQEARLDVDVESIAWNEEAQEFVLKDVSLTFDFLGSRVTLKGVESVSKPGPAPTAMVFTWQGAAATPGRLAVRRARLCVGASSQLRLRHELSIAPGGVPGLTAPVAVTAVEAWGSGGDDDWPTDLEPGCSVRVLNMRAPGSFMAGPRSFAVASSAKEEDSISALLPGFPAGGAFEFGMLAAVGDFSDASVALGAGSLSGSIVWREGANAEQTLRLESIRLEAGSGLRGETPNGWQGRLLLSGDVVGTSSIAWPAIELGTGASVPMPPVDTTITPVERVSGVWYRHTVTWLLRSHEMPFVVAASLCERGDTVWSVTALARHKLTRVAERGDKAEALDFSSIDTLTLAPMRVFAPPWPAGGRAADLRASSTFAARYVTGVDNKPDPGMAWPGRGGVGSVLQGFSGELFREAFYARGVSGDGQSLVIVAGFSGFVTLPGADAAPLLRLPTLVALEGSLRVPTGATPVIRQDADVPVNVAWVDGVAASDLVVPWRAAVTTVTAAHADLESAMNAGIRRPLPSALRPERLFNAILVEQCFPVALDGSHGLARTPYFIASMVSLARVLAHVQERKTGQPEVSVATLSVLSRVSLVRASGKAYRMGAASVLQASLGQTDSSPMPPRPPGRLLVVGDDLTNSPWLSSEVGTEADGRVATVATELHKRPRIALVRDAQGKHTTVGLPQRQLRPSVRRTPALLYADVARGYMLEPEEGMLMAGAEEGWTGSLRDLASGIAAMGRVAALPALARGGTGGGIAVWHTQQRVPIYLPIASTIQSDPITWMDPGSARTRVPVEAAVNGALARAVGAAREVSAEDGATAPESATWQGIVPDRLATTSVSDRAGVLFARSQRLETAARREDGGGYPFDEDFPSFGEPAQSSSVHARTERTPRPGILPVNTVDMERNRRPCASPLQSKVNNRAVLGPADTVGGRTWWKYEGAVHGVTYGVTWSTMFVACPRTCGVISDPWDGTLDIAVEVDVLEEGAQASLPAYLAAFVLGANIETRKVAARASIVVNGAKYSFASLHVRDFFVGPPRPLGMGMRRGHVTLVLDMRDVGTASTIPGPAHPALYAIRNAGPVPPAVEVQFTLHPKANAEVSITPLPADVRFALDAEQAIPYGCDRAPVTLRLPLFPVTRERGAVPLEPATLLFMDPAYDAGLASQPIEAALRIPEKTPSAAMPRGRGDMRLVLSADRARVNRSASITFMADLSFERRLPAHLSELLMPGTGDIKSGSDDADNLLEPCTKDPERLVLEVQVQPRAGERRELFIAPRGASAPTRCRLKLAAVYELALTSLVEADGSAAQLLAGDVLELLVRKAPASGFEPARGADAMLEVEVLNAAELGGKGQWKLVTFDMTDRNLTLRLTLTDEPVIEPPPTLYAALLRKRVEHGYSLSLPLYAQSPLPWRVDLPNAKADFRAGLMRRTATFVWSLLRPADERELLDVFVVKCDRNGQTYLPDEASASVEFQAFGKLA